MNNNITQDRIKTVYNDLLNLHAKDDTNISTSMLDVLSLVGFNFETFLRYANATTYKKYTVINLLIESIKQDLLD